MFKCNLLKTVFATIIACAITGNAGAHSVSGSVAKGSTDVYNFQCFTDTLPHSEGSDSSLPADRVVIRLVRTSGPGVSAQLGHIPMGAPANQNWTKQVIDSTTGAGEVALLPPAGKTAGVWNSHGYNLTVRNTAAVARTYTVDFHCRKGALHTGTGAYFSNSQTPGEDISRVINN